MTVHTKTCKRPPRPGCVFLFHKPGSPYWFWLLPEGLKAFDPHKRSLMVKMDDGESVGPLTPIGWGEQYQDLLEENIARVLEEHAHKMRLEQGKRMAVAIKRVSGTRKEK